MFIHIPERPTHEGIAPTLELQIRARLDNAPTEYVGEAVTISSPQYETFIAQCTEALQRDKSIDLEVSPASANDTETITIVNDSGITVEDMRETLNDLIGDAPDIGVTISVNDGQYTITLTAVPDLPVLEAHVETLTGPQMDTPSRPPSTQQREPRFPHGPRRSSLKPKRTQVGPSATSIPPTGRSLAPHREQSSSTQP